ncbi:sugar-binding transcriptional regulator [Rhodohalobacter sp. 614A]|uniref:sugar-binding transcriptional regulator n=1 Tax=Rhodohalobacter sp. 614A TaxID=2908649 RepID=UPI001F47BCE6|nr:sugar-binding transcriptional regulator [Rhodohalobacter sp. 614A]
MARTKDPIDIRLISKISTMYYNQDYNQQQIANRLHLSRPKVSRMLKQAREQGIVQITITTPNSNFVELEHSLENKFGLKEVILVESDADMSADVIKRQIGSAAANYLNRTAQEGDVIGVTWGTTLQAMVESMQPKPINGLHIVQALGGVGPPEAKAHAADISRRLSQLLNAKLTLLPAPGIVGSVQAKEVLMDDPQVKNALDLFPIINTLFVGIGALKTNPVLNKKSKELSESTCREILNSDAVGDIALHFFDANGNEAKTRLKDLILGVSPEQVMQIETVVGIAGGPEKEEVIHAALLGKNINVLISDSLTAKKVLEI